MDASGETLVVLTALPLEYKAVRRLLEGLERVDQAGTVFERGRLAGTPWTVYLAATGPGNDSAADDRSTVMQVSAHITANHASAAARAHRGAARRLRNAATSTDSDCTDSHIAAAPTFFISCSLDA